MTPLTIVRSSHVTIGGWEVTGTGMAQLRRASYRRGDMTTLPPPNEHLEENTCYKLDQSKKGILACSFSCPQALDYLRWQSLFCSSTKQLASSNLHFPYGG